MRRGWTWLLLCVLAVSPFVHATEGMFQGRLVDPPTKEQRAKGWVFVQGRNRMVRRVDVSNAVVIFTPSTSSHGGKTCDSECLSVGQEVRVTAEQDASGEWRAKRVEILEDSPSGSQSSQIRTARGSVFTQLNHRLSGVAG